MSRLIVRDPTNQQKYLAKNTFISSGTLIFCVYWMWKNSLVEKKMTKIYLGGYTME